MVIGVAPQVSLLRAAAPADALRRRVPGHPPCGGTTHSEELVELVARREVQAGLGRRVRHPLVTYTPIYDDQLVLVSPPDLPLAQTDTASRSALADTPLILFDRASSYYELTTALLREAGVRPRGVIELDNVEAAKRMVACGLGVALLPRTPAPRRSPRAAWPRCASRAQIRRRATSALFGGGTPRTAFPALAAFLALVGRVPELIPGATAPATMAAGNTAEEGG